MEECRHLTIDTHITSYLSIPTYLIGVGLGSTTLLIYGMLLTRVSLSQKNGWIDENGRVYIYYAIANIARDIGRGETAVKDSLKELETAGLLIKKRDGFNKPNRLYIKVPKESIVVGKASSNQSGNRLASSRKTNWHTGGKAPPNYKSEIQNKISNQYTYEEGESF